MGRGGSNGRSLALELAEDPLVPLGGLQPLGLLVELIDTGVGGLALHGALELGGEGEGVEVILLEALDVEEEVLGDLAVGQEETGESEEEGEEGETVTGA